MILIKWEYKEICEFLAVDIYEIVDIYWVLEGLNKVIQVYQTVTHFLPKLLPKLWHIFCCHPQNI